MKSVRIAALALLSLIVLACGGGGGGGGAVPVTPATLVGRVLSVETGAATTPRSSIQVGGTSVIQSDDGSFQLSVPQNTASLTVDTRSAWGTFAFTFPAASGTTDVGDLWVGPSKVTVKGKVLNAAAGNVPVAGVAISFAGKTGTTNSLGEFTLAGVAYSGVTQTAFWGIVGSARKDNFFKTDFSAQPNVAIAGVVTVNDILISPSDGINPPPTPFNIWGRVAPSASAPGTIATLKENGVAVRITNVGADLSYFFWVPPGTYTIEFVKGPLTASASATLTAPNQVIRRDVTLN